MRAGRSGFAAVVAGTLALGAFTAPPAQAADTGVKMSNVVLNKGKPIIVGTSAEVFPTLTYRLSWPSGLKQSDVSAFLYLYHGTTAAKAPERKRIRMVLAACEDGTVAADCRGELYVDPRYTLDSNNDATTWKSAVWIQIWNAKGGLKSEQYLPLTPTVRVKRAAKVTVDASPEPVVKGRKLAVTGKITRADWAKHKYTGFGGKAAKLQFRKAGTSTYKTVKIVKANSTGALKTTVTASVDGYWRWTFGETNTTGGATAAGDYVDVK
ncbi:hypothetical protein [Streptomyces sp. PTD5-9]|uniref:hypothetical protein n=1 Tax=Streptomyces sp. PTD5-9 TaxID=3120150 RepID=UPI0030082B7E